VAVSRTGWIGVPTGLEFRVGGASSITCRETLERLPVTACPGYACCALAQLFSRLLTAFRSVSRCVTPGEPNPSKYKLGRAVNSRWRGCSLFREEGDSAENFLDGYLPAGSPNNAVDPRCQSAAGTTDDRSRALRTVDRESRASRKCPVPSLVVGIVKYFPRETLFRRGCSRKASRNPMPVDSIHFYDTQRLPGNTTSFIEYGGDVAYPSVPTGDDCSDRWCPYPDATNLHSCSGFTLSAYYITARNGHGESPRSNMIFWKCGQLDGNGYSRWDSGIAPI
jgi:hypothetical protein